MYKVRVVLLLCLFFICDSIVPMKSYAASYQKGDIMLKLNNSFLIYSNQGMPFVKNERTYIPLRMINEIMGAEIEWLSNEKKVRIFSGADKVIVLKVNSKIAQINGVEVILDNPPLVVNQTTFVPLRFVSEYLGIGITYNSKLKLVKLESEKFFSAEKQKMIDDVDPDFYDSEFNGELLPVAVEIVDDQNNLTTINVKVLNTSSITLAPTQLHRNSITILSDGRVGFDGTRGMTSTLGPTGLNKEELKQHEVHEDKIITFGELKGGDYKGQIYVFVNYFKTKAGSM